MNTARPNGPFWTTVSLGGTTEPSPVELSVLEDHLRVCRRLCGRLFAIRCRADLLHRFVAARFVTTLVVLTLLTGVVLQLL